MNRLFSFDVRLKDLESLMNNSFSKVKMVMGFLKSFWFDKQGGSSPEYWDRVRIGSIDVYLDDSDRLHLDFSTRFHLTNEPEALQLLKDLEDE